MWRVHTTDPSALVEAAFRRIERERMAGVPLLNPALSVQAVDFTRWQGHWLGALVTPWFLNLMLVPGQREGWHSVREGERVFHRFGAGDFAFLGNAEAEIGEFQTCSLVSPMAGYDQQRAAVDTARAALRMLHVDQPAAAMVGAAACDRSGDRSTLPADAANAAPSRRRILFGRRAAAGPA